jgi:hypothetical protein
METEAGFELDKCDGECLLNISGEGNVKVGANDCDCREVDSFLNNIALLEADIGGIRDED